MSNHIPEFIDEEEPPQLLDGQLSKLHETMRKQLELELEVERQESTLKETKAQLRRVQEVDLPAIMDELGVQSMDVDDYRVKVDDQVYMNIPKKNLPECAQWLKEHGMANLVKEEVYIPFDFGDTRADEFIDFCENFGWQTSSREGVVTQSVKAAIKQMLANGDEVPLQLFGGQIVRSTTIKRKK